MDDLRRFIDKVKEMGELRVIEGVDWNLEMGAVIWAAAQGTNVPALLFDRIKGYPAGYRILATPCSTERRIALALGLPQELTRLELVRKVKDKLSEPFKPVPPIEVKSGPVMENNITGDEVDLFKLPVPKWQSLDGGRYIGTGDTVIVRDPDDGWVNVGTYRIQIHDRDTATIFIEPGKHANIIRRKYWDKGLGCPAAVTCGSHPLHVFVGSNRIPWAVSEYDYQGWWQGEPVTVIKLPTSGLPVPADAEIVLEGEMMSPEVDYRMEGPFSEWAGYYSPGRRESAFKVKRILHRNNPILLAVLPYFGHGIPYWMNHVIRSAMVWNELERTIPGVKGVWSHQEFSPRGAVVISIEQKYAGQDKQAGMIALSVIGYMQKIAIVVDDDVDPSNLREVLWAVGLRSDPQDWDIIKKTWGGDLDPLLSPERRKARDYTHSSAIISACKPYQWIKEFPPMITPDPALLETVQKKYGNLLT